MPTKEELTQVMGKYRTPGKGGMVSPISKDTKMPAKPKMPAVGGKANKPRMQGGPVSPISGQKTTNSMGDMIKARQFDREREARLKRLRDRISFDPTKPKSLGQHMIAGVLASGKK